MVFEEVSRVFQRSYMDVSRKLQGRFKGVLTGCFKEVSRVLHESFMEEEVS